jgi:DNA-binding CsgD family transcriptional regulator
VWTRKDGSGYVPEYKGPVIDRISKKIRQVGDFERFPCGDRRYPLPLMELSKRDILWLKELSNGTVSAELTGSPSKQVAKNRLVRIRQYFGAQTTTQAVAEAIRRGLIR